MADSWWRRRSKFFRGWAVLSLIWIASIIAALNFRMLHLHEDKAAFVTFFPPLLVGAVWFGYHKFVK